VRPNKPNPAYKGKWTAPLIDNPEYIGEWKARQIANPAFFVDNHPHRLPALAGVAVEIWTMTAGLTFDNILIGSDEAAAAAFASQTWSVEHGGQAGKSDAEDRAAKKAAREKVRCRARRRLCCSFGSIIRHHPAAAMVICTFCRVWRMVQPSMSSTTTSWRP
jgi:hypothetical protein